jgi:hypothetical protein
MAVLHGIGKVFKVAHTLTLFPLSGLYGLLAGPGTSI